MTTRIKNIQSIYNHLASESISDETFMAQLSGMDVDSIGFTKSGKWTAYDNELQCFVRADNSGIVYFD